MSAVIGDLVPDVSRFRDMLVSHQHHQQQHSHSHPHPQSHPQQQHPRHRSLSQTHDAACSSCSACSPRRSTTSRPTPATPPRPHCRHDAIQLAQDKATAADAIHTDTYDVKGQSTLTSSARASSPRRGHDDDDSAAIHSRIPSPPPSSSPASSPIVAAAATAGPFEANDEKVASSMASQTYDPPRPLAPSHASSMSAPSRRHRQSQPQQPSPPADAFQIPSPTLAHDDASRPVSGPAAQQQQVIHVRDLAHVRTLAAAHRLGADAPEAADATHTKYEISGMPMCDIIEMVAALLTKITSTNDLQHDAMQRNVAHQQQANQTNDASGNQISPVSHSVLAFHGKNVPAITILSYLSRIHKYCPTTFEVFLSLLVYFDRMTERVNDLVTKTEEPASQLYVQPSDQQDTQMQDDDHPVMPDADESDSDLADDDEPADGSTGQESNHENMTADGQPGNPGPVACFVVDSFNIHRLIIAGVTCASKFFSDVFYTNSRYAKVGGLPLAELNHLEIQFLVLNDFRLAVPVEDLEAYATMLVEFYAREVIQQPEVEQPAVEQPEDEQPEA